MSVELCSYWSICLYVWRNSFSDNTKIFSPLHYQESYTGYFRHIINRCFLTEKFKAIDQKKGKGKGHSFYGVIPWGEEKHFTRRIDLVWIRKPCIFISFIHSFIQKKSNFQALPLLIIWTLTNTSPSPLCYFCKSCSLTCWPFNYPFSSL